MVASLLTDQRRGSGMPINSNSEYVLIATKSTGDKLLAFVFHNGKVIECEWAEIEFLENTELRLYLKSVEPDVLSGKYDIEKLRKK